MRKGIKFLAAAIVGLGGLSANAATIYAVRSPGTGDLAGNDVVRFFAQKTAGSNEVSIIASKVTLNSPNGFKYLTGQFAPPNSGAANPDIDLFGVQTEDATVRTQNEGIGTMITIRDPDFDQYFVGNFLVDGVSQSTGKVNSSTTNNPTQFFAPVKEIRAEGVVNNSAGTPYGDTNIASEPLGALFAIAVVPTGSDVTGSGLLSIRQLTTGGAESFNDQNFNIVNQGVPVPEPVGLACVGLGAMGLIGRRRRA